MRTTYKAIRLSGKDKGKTVCGEIDKMNSTDKVCFLRDRNSFLVDVDPKTLKAFDNNKYKLVEIHRGYSVVRWMIQERKRFLFWTYWKDIHGVSGDKQHVQTLFDDYQDLIEETKAN